MKYVYLDYAAGTPAHTIQDSTPTPNPSLKGRWTTQFGNPSSIHSPGVEARSKLNEARRTLAKVLNCYDYEVYFMPNSTYSIATALTAGRDGTIITSNIEHPAVLENLNKKSETNEYDNDKNIILKVEENGILKGSSLREALNKIEILKNKEKILVTIMYANNEIGVIQPVKEISTLAKKNGILYFSDAVQAVGKIPVDVNKDGIDIMAFTAHKMYGPKGIGSLYVRRKNPRVKVTAQMDGGGHERGMRSGTLNVPGIVGFGKACELARLEMADDAIRLSKLRDKLENSLMQLEEAYVNGNREHRLPHVTNISFKYVEGEGLLMGFNKNIALSSGSACTSASLEPSYVLKALGLGDDLAHSSLRFGLGRFTTEDQIDYTIKAVSETVLKLRDMSPLWEMFKEGVDMDKIEWASH